MYNNSKIIIYKSKYYYPNNLAKLLHLQKHYSSETDSDENINLSTFEYDKYKYFTIFSYEEQKNQLLLFYDDSKPSQQISKLKITILIFAIVGLIIFVFSGIKMKGKKRKNNFDDYYYINI